MNKQDAIKRITDDLRKLGFTFVESRQRVASQHYAMSDQAATRENPCLDGTILCALACIGMRKEFGR